MASAAEGKQVQPANDDDAYGEALVRAELAPGELWARVALIVGLCAGAGFLGLGIYDYTHVGRPKGLAANLSLGIGTALVPATLALLLTLRGKSRDRRRLIELYGVAAPWGKTEQALGRRRTGWTAVCVFALGWAGLPRRRAHPGVLSPTGTKSPTPPFTARCWRGPRS